MAPSAESAAHAQIDFLTDSLRRLDQRYVDVHAALSDARIALEHATRAVDTLSAEEESLCNSRIAVQNDIAARRSALDRSRADASAARVRRILAAFPSELLRAVFLDVASHAKPTRGGDLWGRVKRKYTSAPFMLAAVNRQWREVALGTTRLWTLVMVPTFEARDGPMFFAYVDLMLRRSRDHPLRVFLSWTSAKLEESDCYGKIISALVHHSTRWLQLSVGLPEQAPEDFWRIFRHTMPIMEDLYLARSYTEGMQASPLSAAAYFPFYPRLRRLHAHCMGFLAVPRQPLTDLVDLDLRVCPAVAPDTVWAFLCATPSLERLRLFFEITAAAGAATAPNSTLTLPNLVLFGIYGDCDDAFSAFLSWLSMPRLLALAVYDPHVLVPLTEPAGPHASIADTVATLVIQGLEESYPRLPADLQRVRRLQKLCRMVFSEWEFVGADVPAAFASRAAAGLPLLETVEFENPKLDEEEAVHLAGLMQTLHAAGVPKFRLTAKAGEVPEWLLQQYACLSEQQSSG